MSRIGDALKRSGSPDATGDIPEMPAADLLTADPVPEPVQADTAAEIAVSEAASPTFNGAPVKATSRLVVNPGLPSIAVEQYRRLAATLHHVQEDRGIKRVLISSAVADEGKTLTSANLALTLSQSYGRNVLLIDADLRRPRIHSLFGVPNDSGLSDGLDNGDPQKLTLVQVSPCLWILPAGRATPDPMAGLTSSRMAAILSEAGERFDWVVIDSPPVGLLSDAKLLAAMTDAALLVIGAGSTPFATIERAIEGLGRERVLGVVLNRVDERLASAGQYHYYHGYYGSNHNGNTGIFSRLGRLLGRT